MKQTILVSEKEISDYYEEVIKGCDKKLATNWITVELFAVLNKKNLVNYSIAYKLPRIYLH